MEEYDGTDDIHPLTGRELSQLRRVVEKTDDILEIIKETERARWLWAMLRTVAIWISAVTIGIAAFKNSLLELLTGKH